MKDRARQIGESAAHELVRDIMLAAPAARIHLMAHSFGCIVVSASIAGPSEAPPLPKPVDTLFLVQGALSIWAYTEDIPYARGTDGYFHRILKNELVSGPIVTTRSKFDTAVGYFYPLGASSARQIVLAPEDYPPYGGLGAFGIQAVAAVKDLAILPATSSYNFEPGLIYNLEASEVIKNGSGVSGAHNDIAHAEVAHAFWQAVLVACPAEFSRGSLRGGTFDERAEQKGQQPQPATSGGGLLGVDAQRQSDPYEWEREQQRREQRLEQTRYEQRQTTRLSSSKAGKGSRSNQTSSGNPNRELLAPSTITELRRWINVEVEGNRRTDPLTSGVTYKLMFDIDVEERSRSIGVSPLQDSRVFAPQETEATLTVQLDSDDFAISKRVDSLILQREGRSSKKAFFEITPRHNGTSKIKATIHREGNFIQQMELSFQVGTRNVRKVGLTALGRPASAVTIVKPRDIGISISPAVGGYDLVIWGAVMARARLPLNPAELAKAVDVARSELMKVVMRRSADNKFVFQSGVDIPDVDRDFALTTMARAGAALFRRLFWGPSMAADANKVGDFLREVATASPELKLQVLADSAPIPWGMLYLGDASDGATLGWENFLGMRHVIEMIPLQNTLAISAAEIPSDQPTLAVSVNVNREIDTQMGVNLVAQQERYWVEAGKIDNIRVIPRATTTEVVNALASGSADEQIFYFYCHAKSADLADSGGPDSSCLVLTDGGVTLGELCLNAPTTAQLRNNPLVFINACESAELSPTFYDGFVPYFMAKGARGVIGTECKVPALFAAEWAARFFPSSLRARRSARLSSHCEGNS
jgi:CHAT domain